MEVWLSAELSREVLTEDHLDLENKARNTVENALNAQLQNKSYDIPIDKWKCIEIMMGNDSFDERIFIHLSVEIWISVLRIDPTNFKATDDLGRERLIFRMLLRSLDLLKVKFEKARPKLDAKVYEELERLKMMH